MTSWFISYTPLFETSMFNMLLALSQYIVFRAGIFSVATAALAALGAYAAAIIVTKAGLSPALGIVVSVVLGGLLAGLVALPLARLRGVFQALATIALVQMMLSLTTNWVTMTDGPLGINGIPKTVGVIEFLIAVGLVVYLLSAIGSSSLGRAFDVIREDETVAVSLGISVPKHHLIAFILSGAIAALAGAMHAYSSYSITPNEYGFHMLVLVLAMVVLGGRGSVLGPIVGATIMTILPEILRGFQEYRMIVQGLILMLAIIFLPEGIVDTTMAALRRRRLREQARKNTLGKAVKA